MLSDSDLVFTSAEPFVRRFQAISDCAIVEAPEEFDEMSVYLFWHERAHHSTFSAWLRAQVGDLVRAVCDDCG